jgi:hypothetical protein
VTFYAIEMKRLNKITLMWGIFDLLAIVWYMGWNIYHGKLPIANDVQLIIENTTSFGLPSLMYVAFFGVLIYFSLLASGFYLIKLKKAGAIISYIQTPFRLLVVIPPSIFFILWPLKYLFEKPPIIIGIILIILSELCKLFTVIKWHRSLGNVEPVT